MKILVFGDIFGRKGRELLTSYMPQLRAEHAPDFIVANSENVTSGKGPTLAHIQDLAALGIDGLTGGNHSFTHLDDIGAYMDSEESIQIRPANYFESKHYHLPGRGATVLKKDGKSLLLVNVISGTFMRDQVGNPFLKVEEILEQHAHAEFDAILVDFHRETTAESYCMAEFLSGKATFVYGTHTHVQTNDEHILASGTGMITDVGMTGPLHSSIGHTFDGHLPRFISGVGVFSGKAEPAKGPGVLSAILVEVEAGKCIRLEKIRIQEAV